MPTTTLSYTGANQSFVVPTGITKILVDVRGASGGRETNRGGVIGKGGRSQAILAVTPGETLTIVVGGVGGSVTSPQTAAGAAGWPDGAAGGQPGTIAGGGGGGGASKVKRSSTDLVIGGGGGGAASGVTNGGPPSFSYNGGDGGHGGTGSGTGGQNGPDWTYSGDPGGNGTASTAGSGGAGGISGHGLFGNASAGSAGSTGAGGAGGGASTASGPSYSGGAGGGGGGGLRGGGGGGGGCIKSDASAAPGGGGGGGSSYINPTGLVAGSDVLTAGFQTGNGSVIITYAGNPSAPTSIVPVSAATVTTDIPTLQATVAAHPDGPFLQKVQWDLATNSGFSSNLRTITEDNSAFRASGVASLAVPEASQLFQGTWFIRARVLDEFGNASAYSSTLSFTVAHAPTAGSLTPSGGISSLYAASMQFDWVFSDPSPVDFQTAYQVVVERNDNGAAVADTGKVTSATASALIAISATYKDVALKWKVRVYDSDDVVSAYSSYSVYTPRDAPVVAIDEPDEADVVNNPSPTITWTFTASASRTQATYRVLIVDTSSLLTVYDSGILAGAAVTHTPSTPVLETGESYTVAVTVTDSVGLTGADTNGFTADWTKPDAPTFTVTP